MWNVEDRFSPKAIEGLAAMGFSVGSTRGVVRVACWLSVSRSLFDGKEPMLTPEKYRRAVGTIICDCTKAARELGYRTSPLSSMLADTIAWLRAEGTI